MISCTAESRARIFFANEAAKTQYPTSSNTAIPATIGFSVTSFSVLRVVIYKTRKITNKTGGNDSDKSFHWNCLFFEIIDI
jgi:hypothetical protein